MPELQELEQPVHFISVGCFPPLNIFHAHFLSQEPSLNSSQEGNCSISELALRIPGLGSQLACYQLGTFVLILQRVAEGELAQG